MRIKVHYYFPFQALCGAVVKVPTLSGETMTLDFHESVIKPSQTRRIPGRGLPHPKDTARKGDIVVAFDIQFPDALDNHSRDVLRSTLPNK